MALSCIHAFKYAWTWSKSDCRLLLHTVVLCVGATDYCTPPADPAEKADEKKKPTKVS